MTNDQFPAEDFLNAGYQALFNGQKTYNGVALITKQSTTEAIYDIPKLEDPQRRVIGAKVSDVFVLNLYIPNGSEVDSEKYHYKLNWLNHLQNLIGDLIKQHSKMAIMGDFNIAPKDEDVHDPDAWRDKILCSEPEREQFQKILGQGFHDCFRLFEQEKAIFSWWDYRAAGFRRNHGLRIDHILASDALKGLCQGCSIDKTPRKLERPSDHAPVIAEFEL